MCRENYLAGSVPPHAHRRARRQSDFAGLGVRLDHRHAGRSRIQILITTGTAFADALGQNECFCCC